MRHLSLALSRFAGLCLLMALLSGMARVHAGDVHPLEPLDTSSPRATLNGFLVGLEDVYRLVRDEYWENPSYATYQDIISRVVPVLRTLDLSEVPPSTRGEVSYQAVVLLYEILTRLELPPLEDIPDAAAFEAVEDPAKWSIPHTEIVIARVSEGPRKGEFLFSPATVERLGEFHGKIRTLPYRRAVPIEDVTRLRQLTAGWWVPMSAIERLPDWLKLGVLDQAVWKWAALLILLVLAAALTLLVHRFTQRGVPDNPLTHYGRRISLPLFLLLLISAVAYLITEQINMTGRVSMNLLLMLQTIKYVVATWVAWLGSLLAAEVVIRSPKIEPESLNAQLLRLTARIAGITFGLTIVFYGANQIGLPLVGVLAGVGVGGLAIALAAQDSLKNLLGSLMIFMDQPYAPGQRIVVEGHDGFVEQIGLRSTKIRMLTGALTSIPNERMARLDIENIGRRSFIRRQTNIRLSYDTPLEKVDRAVEIIEEILHNHEGMKEQLPPRVFFDEFNPDSLNIFVSYWYHPPKRWKALAFDHKVNREIMRRFKQEDIGLALPASRTYLRQEDCQPSDVLESDQHT